MNIWHEENTTDNKPFARTAQGDIKLFVRVIICKGLSGENALTLHNVINLQQKREYHMYIIYYSKMQLSDKSYNNLSCHDRAPYSYHFLTIAE